MATNASPDPVRPLPRLPVLPKKQKRTVNGRALIPQVVAAAIGTRTFSQSTREMTSDERGSLSRALSMDVDQWRAEFGQQLRETGQELLRITRRDLELIKPDARAYTLAVLIDKALALEGRSQVTAAAVNIQVNNFGSMSKEALIESLAGKDAGHGAGQGKGQVKEAETVTESGP